MKKRVFIIHGWGGAPDEGWRPWLIEKIGDQAQVYNLSMPNSNYPQETEWVDFLSKAIYTPDSNTYLIGHSLGCITILRYLETLKDGEKIGGAFLVAAFSDDLRIPELKNFFQKQIQWDEIKKHADVFVSIFSDNDPIVDHDTYSRIFKEKLGSKIVTAHNMLHFSGDDGITQFPDLLHELKTNHII